MKHTIEEQIAEVGREIGLRRNVYRGYVARGKMEQSEADDHIAKMESVYATLKFIKANREAFLAAVEASAVTGPSR